MRTRFSARLDRPCGPPSLQYNGYRVFPGSKERPGRDAVPSPLLVPWSRKSRAIILLPLWAVRPVQSLSACTRVHFTFTFTSNLLRKIMLKNCENENFLNYSYHYRYILYRIWCTDKHTGKSIYTFTYLFIQSSFCVLGFYVAGKQTEFYRSCSHHIKGWAGLHYVVRLLQLKSVI